METESHVGRPWINMKEVNIYPNHDLTEGDYRKILREIAVEVTILYGRASFAMKMSPRFLAENQEKTVL